MAVPVFEGEKMASLGSKLLHGPGSHMRVWPQRLAQLRCEAENSGAVTNLLGAVGQLWLTCVTYTLSVFLLHYT